MHPNSRTQSLVAWHVRVVYNVFSFIDTVVTHHRSRAEFDLRRQAKSGSVGPHRALHDDIKSCKCERTIPGWPPAKWTPTLWSWKWIRLSQLLAKLSPPLQRSFSSPTYILQGLYNRCSGCSQVPRPSCEDHHRFIPNPDYSSTLNSSLSKAKGETLPSITKHSDHEDSDVE